MAKSKSPVPSDRPPSLQRFSLEELAPFTKEGMFAKSASRDFHLFCVGRDDVHGVLKYLLSRASTSLYLNMFGYDDEELNVECMRCALDASITTVITLDKSQAGGKHEKAILDSDVAKDPVAFNTHVVVGQSATHQITHTKGGVLDGSVGCPWINGVEQERVSRPSSKHVPLRTQMFTPGGTDGPSGPRNLSLFSIESGV
jgi:hypothetical protein